MGTEQNASKPGKMTAVERDKLSHALVLLLGTCGFLQTGLEQEAIADFDLDSCVGDTQSALMMLSEVWDARSRAKEGA